MTEYLTPADPGAFTDMKRRTAQGEHRHRCPLCRGYGGWNLTLNAYKLPPGMRNTKANRASYCHFSCCCSQCNGWGWVTARDTECIHEWHEISAQEAHERGLYHAGNCWHVYVCAKGCGRTTAADSSG
jgi:hypothetical protein